MNKIDLLFLETNKISDYYELFAKKHQLSFTLLAITYSLLNYNQMTQKEIAKAWCLPKQTVNNEIVKMQKEGYLEVSKNLSDGRKKSLNLTIKGKEKYAPIITKLVEIENKIISSYPEIDNLINKIQNLNLIYQEEFKDA